MPRREASPNWRGGRHVHTSGYANVYAPDHPDADNRGYVKEHRLVMEQHLGRRLESSEHVHHINGVKDDNRIENLQVLSASAHHKIHGSEAGKKGAAARWGKR